MVPGAQEHRTLLDQRFQELTGQEEFRLGAQVDQVAGDHQQVPILLCQCLEQAFSLHRVKLAGTAVPVVQKPQGSLGKQPTLASQPPPTQKFVPKVQVRKVQHFDHYLLLSGWTLNFRDTSRAPAKESPVFFRNRSSPFCASVWPT